MSARPADGFVDSMGVDTHTSYTNKVYVSRFAEVKERLVELGVRHIREDLTPENPGQYARLNELAASGVGSTLIMGKPTDGTIGLEKLLSTVKGRLARVDALEGPNEYDIRGGSSWSTELTNYQQKLYELAKRDPVLSQLPVLGPSIARWTSNDVVLGDVSRWVDYGNIHSYPGGYYPERDLSAHLSRAATNFGTKSIIATETGYHTALDWTGGNLPVSEQAMGTYMPRLSLEYFRSGVARTFSYELVDEGTNSAAREDKFGLLRNDLSEKPAFVALRNLIDILEDPGTSFVPGSLAYSLDGNQESLRQVLLQKRDGTFYLALWRATSVWDPVNKVALDPGSSPVTVSFQQPISSIQVFAPNSSSTPVSSVSSPGSSLSLDIGPEVRIVRIAPASTSSPPPPEEEPAPGPEPEPTPTPESEPTPSPEPAPESTPEEETKSPKKGNGRGGKPKQRTRLALWTGRRSVRVGQRLALRGRVIAPAPAAVSVAIQRWDHGWRTVSQGRTSETGFFGKRIRVTRRHGARIVRLRVVAPATMPSRPIRVRIES